MRVFVTGASGHVGRAIVPELLRHGHAVVGLARSAGSARRLEEQGAETVLGDLDDLDVLRAAAAAADGVIHLAFRHDLMYGGDLTGAVQVDLRAIEALTAALAGSGKPLVGTAGTLVLAIGGIDGLGTEEDVVDGHGRVASENAVIGAADHGVRSSVVRLAPVVHSELDTAGLVPELIGMARRRSASGWLADGRNRWPAVHTLDAAVLYRLALEAAPAGTRLHAVAEEGVPFRAIATAIGAGLGLPAGPVPAGEAEEVFGFLADSVGLDDPTSSARTRALLGWAPGGPGLLEDLAAGFYFGRDRSTDGGA